MQQVDFIHFHCHFPEFLSHDGFYFDRFCVPEVALDEGYKNIKEFLVIF